MCGVLAVFGKKDKLHVEKCNDALLSMTHRGPDHQGFSTHMDGRLYLGQTVLSITGNGKYRQELEGGRYRVLFNGEIYNHAALYSEFLQSHGLSWDSCTDTEVLAKLHIILSPAETYKHLSGMFTYVVYDAKREALLVGRDMVGEKFLYCYEDKNLLIFSSEMAPILSLVTSIRMDLDMLREYFFTRHLLTHEQSVWKGIKLVPPGQLREYDLSELRYRSTLYACSLPSLIDPQRVEDNRKHSEDEIVEELEVICREVAHDLCPKIEYISVVSGGVDSSLASWFMGENGNKPELLALQFPGKDYPSSDESLDEFKTATGWTIKRYRVGEDEYRNHLEICYEMAHAPLPTHSYVSQAILAETVRDLGLRILIIGEGGDEFFGGYEAYRSFADIAEIPPVNPSPYSGLSPCGVEFEGWKPEALQERQLRDWRLALEYNRHEEDPLERTSQAALLLDATLQLQSVGIRSADQMSMAYSVEARSFYLHNSLVRFALNLPLKYKLNFAEADVRFTTKYLLKKLFARKFGADLLRPKNGFSGWPNEAVRILVGSDYYMVNEVLGPFKLNYAYRAQWRAAEWKMQNMEMFLRRFASYA